MGGLKETWKRLVNNWDLKGGSDPSYIVYLMRTIYQILEDVYSVSGEAEIQNAIDQIATTGKAGTIFIEAGTHQITVPLTIDSGGSFVIYGHGDNTILQPDDGVSVFNITNAESVIFKNFKIDASNYTGATQSVIVNETNDNVISFEDITIIGNNVGIGIELQSNNCMVEHCNISFMNDAIYINNSNRQIVTQNIIQKNARYGISVNISLYSSINLNTCNQNLTGIYLNNSMNNSISNNICNLNTENGIYIYGSSYNTLSSNTCENNDSNTANSQGGLVITNNSNFNTISGNSLNNNNNIGAGEGYGLIIATATCEENVVASNNYNGNDIDIHDIGVGTTVKYYVQSVDELQDAINSIGTKAGVIHINSSFTVSIAIDIDGGGSYIIEGEGSNSTLTTVGDIQCFNITSARSVLLQNFKIDITAATSPTTEAINVNEASNNIVTLNNIIITGDGTNGYGIECNSNNCRIENCTIDTVNIGINILSTNNILRGNTANSNTLYGIQLGGNNNTLSSNICNLNLTGIYINSVDYNLFNGNTVNSNTQNGIYLTGADYNSISNNFIVGNDSNTANPQAGVYISSDSNNNTVKENSILNNNNAGAGTTYGVYIDNANCDDNIIKDNHISGNDISWKDLGTTTDIEYRCSTGQEIQDAIDSIGTKAGTVNIPVGTITLSSTININGGGSYSITGKGAGTIIDCGGDRTAFNITNATYMILRDLKIDATDLTTLNKEVITLDEASDNIITLNNIQITGDGTNGYGIVLNSNNCRIKDCNIDSVRIGINIFSTNNILEGNTLNSNNLHGIYTDSWSDNTISGNICNDNEYGIYLFFSSDNTITGNTCNNNNQGGILIFGVSSNTITGNTCNDNNRGMWLYNLSDNTITGNICNDNTLYGIYTDDLTNNTITGNTCNNNTGMGIRVHHSSTNTITGNICSDNDSNNADPQAGIYIDDRSDNNTVIGNCCCNNNNTGAGNGYGIYIVNANCDENIINGNVINGNDVNFLDNGTGTIIMQGGWSGWFDDGVNFRVTVVDGLITNVENSTAGGHS